MSLGCSQNSHNLHQTTATNKLTKLPTSPTTNNKTEEKDTTFKKLTYRFELDWYVTLIRDKNQLFLYAEFLRYRIIFVVQFSSGLLLPFYLILYREDKIQYTIPPILFNSLLLLVKNKIFISSLAKYFHHHDHLAIHDYYHHYDEEDRCVFLWCFSPFASENALNTR